MKALDRWDEFDKKLDEIFGDEDNLITEHQHTTEASYGPTAVALRRWEPNFPTTEQLIEYLEQNPQAVTEFQQALNNLLRELERVFQPLIEALQRLADNLEAAAKKISKTTTQTGGPHGHNTINIQSQPTIGHGHVGHRLPSGLTPLETLQRSVLHELHEDIRRQ